ncbi:hypothetical protein V6Z12_A11G113500 [Gossypium hirsutum]
MLYRDESLSSGWVHLLCSSSLTDFAFSRPLSSAR